MRPEVFAPGALVWGADGIAIRTEHRGAEVARAIPTRGPDGSIRISAIATPEIRAAYASGKRYLSAEFQSLAEIRTAGGTFARFSARTSAAARSSAVPSTRKRAPKSASAPRGGARGCEWRDDHRGSPLDVAGDSWARTPRARRACRIRSTRPPVRASNATRAYAPTEIKNEAVILMAGWLWQATAQSRRVFPDDAEGAPVNVSRAFLLSGAQGLLSSPWRKPRAGACV